MAKALNPALSTPNTKINNSKNKNKKYNENTISYFKS
jgi:hypothetical protein